MTTETSAEVSTASTGKRVRLKTVHGIDVFVTAAGRFEATYSRGSGTDTYSRGNLDDLEADIVANTLAFTGQFDVKEPPPSPVTDYDLKRLDEAVANRSFSLYGNMPSSSITITGVQRNARDRRTGAGGDVYFRASDGRTHGFDRNWALPAPELDNAWLALLVEYRNNQHVWQERFDDLRAKYQRVTAADILAELKRQSAERAS